MATAKKSGTKKAAAKTSAAKTTDQKTAGKTSGAKKAPGVKGSAKKAAAKSSSGKASGKTAKKKTTTTASRKYGPKASEEVREEMHEFKRHQLHIGKSDKLVTNPKQAIAIGLAKARREGGKVPPNPNTGR